MDASLDKLRSVMKVYMYIYIPTHTHCMPVHQPLLLLYLTREAGRPTPPIRELKLPIAIGSHLSEAGSQPTHGEIRSCATCSICDSERDSAGKRWGVSFPLRRLRPCGGAWSIYCQGDKKGSTRRWRCRSASSRAVLDSEICAVPFSVCNYSSIEMMGGRKRRGVWEDAVILYYMDGHIG